MSVWHFDVTTGFRLIGFIHIAMALTVWFVLRGKHPRANLWAWCLGTASLGVGSLVNGMRDLISADLLVPLYAVTIYAAVTLRASALRLEAGLSPRWRLHAGLCFAAVALVLIAYQYSWQARQLATFAFQLAGSAWLCMTALTLWRTTRLPSALLIAIGFGALLVVGMLSVAVVLQYGGNLRLPENHPSSVIVAAAASLVAIYSSLGYLGLSIERSHRKDMASAQQLAHEAAHRKAAEQAATQLQAWLSERENLLRLLAHEVRQPLNNAMAALHATHRVLASEQLDFSAATHRVRRAEAVLGQITGTLDNTLAATALLASPDRIEPRDVDVESVTALSIGDLAPEQRSRVQVHRVSQVRTATMDAGLMRLALRNLLSNAFNHAPPDTVVVLRVTDSDEPLGLVFAVIDQGPGVPPELAEQLFFRGVRGSSSGSGHGLGLYVVRRVMELHGGTAEVGANPGGGAIFRLTLPQTEHLYSSPMPLDWER